MKTLAIIEYTWLEAWAKKISIILSIVVLILLLLFGFGIGVVQLEGSEFVQVSIFGAELPEPMLKSDFVQATKIGALALLNPWGIFLALFITVGLFPSMLSKGRIDLFLSKPIARYQIYLSRYLGALLLVLVTTMFFVLGTWFIIWLKTGLADADLWIIGLLITFLFAIFYSLAALMSLLTESTGISLVITILAWFLAEGAYYRDSIRVFSKILGKIADVLYYMLPKMEDLSNFMVKTVGLERALEEAGIKEAGIGTALWSSALFALAMLALGIYLFSSRDY